MNSNKTNCIRCGIEITFAGEKPLLCSNCRKAPAGRTTVKPVSVDEKKFLDDNYFEVKKEPTIERKEKVIKKDKKEKYESRTDL